MTQKRFEHRVSPTPFSSPHPPPDTSCTKADEMRPPWNSLLSAVLS